MKIHLSQVSPSASKATIRDHGLLIDRPTAKGGADLGPMGGELFLASVAGCYMSNLLAAIAAREADVTNVGIEVNAALADSPTRFTKIELQVSAEGSDLSMLSKLMEIADRGCIMMNTLRGKIDIDIRTKAT